MTARLPAAPHLAGLSDKPWRLPIVAAACSVLTVLCTVLGALLAGPQCNCYWAADWHRYGTISGLAMQPPRLREKSVSGPGAHLLLV